MSTVLEFAKHRSIPLMSCSVNGKRCYSAYLTTRKKEKQHPNLDVLRCTPKGTPGVKSKKPEQTEIKKCFRTRDFIEEGEYRKNALDIQMLPKSLHRQIFGDTLKSDEANPELIWKAKEQLKEHGLLSNVIHHFENVKLSLPALKGKNIEEHFWSIGEEQCKPYRELANSFIKNGLPGPPREWLCQKGWTKYVEGKEPVLIPFPDDDIFIFDVEVCVKLGDLPTLAIAVSPNAWYGWVCSDLAEGIGSIPTRCYKTNMLIPFEGKTVNKEKPRLIIGHNVSYDRARIKEQYYLKNSKLHFLDTMSLHICIGGLSKRQKASLSGGKIELEDDIGKEVCLCSLKELYSLYCGKHLEKEQRNTFVEGLMPDIKKDFQNLMEYCANDVKATYEVLQVIFPIFLKRFPHPVTLAGMLEMGSGFIPVNQNWDKFLVEAEETYEDFKSEISSILSKKCNNACRLLYNEEYKKDLWMWNEDWTIQTLNLTKKKIKKLKSENKNELLEKCQQQEEEEDPEEKELQMKYQYLFDLGETLPKKLPLLPGYPLWYRKLCEKPDSPDWTPNPQLSTSMYITPKLLNLMWENFPLYHTQEYGWGILVPDLLAENIETSIPFEKLKELTIKNYNIDMLKLEQDLIIKGRKKYKKEITFGAPYYKGSGIWCNHIIENCCFFYKIPHKTGGNKNVGNPLSKDIAHVFLSGILSSTDSNAAKVLDLSTKVAYWRNSRDRIINQMVVWLNKKEATTPNDSEEGIQTGIIIPKVVVCGTLTRRAMENTWLTASKVTENRIGSELRSMIQAPPGYHFVGADVDSQELWIASLIGDSHYAKVHGCTPLGWMTLSGSKASGTDMHSITAKAVGISRSQAKIINYARIYGAGVRFAQKLLKQFNPSMTDSDAMSKAEKMYALTKGIKEFHVKDSVLSEFENTFGRSIKIYDLSTAAIIARKWKKKIDDVFERSQWKNGTESAMFNQLEKIASSSKPVTPFLQCRLSHALEPKFSGDNMHLNTRINWVVQSGAVDFLHLMLVCMKWLTNGKARYCFSFHDEVRYMIPSEERYYGALALHITNLLVRSFCSHRLGMHDLPLSVAFFSSVEVDKSLRKEANDDCVTPSNPHGIETEYGIEPGESLSIYKAIEKTGGSLSPFEATKKKAPALSPTPSSQNLEEFKTEMSQATKRKYVHREILHGVLEPPTEKQKIVRVLGSRGSNLHEVETAEATTFLASMPSKFRKNVWIKRGDYILVEPIEEGGKVKAEIVNILTADYIKFLKKENIWPSEFSEKTEEVTNSGNDFFVNSNRKPIFSENES